MPVLLMRLAGPMQAWGTQSRFTVRDTGLEPSKSGVIGLICAAMGRSRSESIEDLVSLTMGVRIDFEGVMKMDFQTAGGVHKRGEEYGVVRSSGKPGETVISNRYYLADADFLVGLEGTDVQRDLLLQINKALNHPVFQLFLGRKSFPPSVPISLPKNSGITEEKDLETALIKYEWPRIGRSIPPEKNRPAKLRFVMEKPYGEGVEIRQDKPETFEIKNRRFFPRSVDTFFKQLGTEVPIRKEVF